MIVRNRNCQSVTAIAKALNLSLQTIYTILRAYERHGDQGLKPQSTPHHQHQHLGPHPKHKTPHTKKFTQPPQPM
ncbi:helix-turn-helix domain-containing protein [Corynebacterium aquilae]|uniref:helix-turn-helix domain-containing protein n=1 Tax=Corynebacterium aquilae TaxID=203263 RepID=UPI000A005186